MPSDTAWAVASTGKIGLKQRPQAIVSLPERYEAFRRDARDLRLARPQLQHVGEIATALIGFLLP